MTVLEQQLMTASGQLISISEVAKLTPYSAGYLSLLARKGKLSAVKINHGWVTTPEVVLEYVKRQEVKHQRLLQDLKSVQRRMA